MASLIESELLRYPVETARQALAQGLGALPALSGNIGPFSTLRSQIGQFLFFGREAFAELDKQLLSGNLAAGAGLGGGNVAGCPGVALQPCHVAPTRLLPPHLIGHLVPGHLCQ